MRDSEPEVRWEGDGTYTPICKACAWEGKKRDVHSDARAASRSHQRSKRHRRSSMSKTIIGRERALIDALSMALNRAIGGPPSKRTLEQLRRHNVSVMWPTDLGCAFEVQIVSPDNRLPTGHIVRVTIELDRFEPQHQTNKED